MSGPSSTYSPCLALYSYTYEPPRVHLEPILRFVERLCEIGSGLGLPISLSANLTPRESFYSEETWARLSKRIRASKIWSLDVAQYPRQGFTMHTSLSDETLPMSGEIELVPEPIPEKPPDLSFLKLNALDGIEKYPTSLSVFLDLKWYDLPRNVKVVGEVAGALTEVFQSSKGAYGYMAIVPDTVRSRFSLSSQDSKAYVSKLDSVVPGVFPVNLLSQGHIEKLGGKEKVVDLFSGCRIEDLSDDEERLCIWLVENIGDFDASVEQRYRPLFAPILAEGKEQNES